MNDATCRALVSTDSNLNDCLANKLCRQLAICSDPCVVKYVACEEDKACVAVLPKPNGNKDPTPEEIAKCMTNPLCKEVALCFEAQMNTTAPVPSKATKGNTKISLGIVPKPNFCF